MYLQRLSFLRSVKRMKTYCIENDKLSLSIKEYGAELHSIVSKDTGFDFLWNGDESVWYGQSPILFPIIGRLLDDKYRYDGNEYTMPKHGLFRKRNAQLVSCDKNKLVLVQTADAETLKSYPFTFVVYITFEIVGKSVKVTHKVVNTNDKTMYFSIGAHPGFKCKIGDYLEFDENETLSTEMIDSDSIRVNKKIPVLNNEKKIVITEHIFDNDALIFSNIKSKHITLHSTDSARRVKFDFGSSPYLGIWAKPGAPYVCLEPWFGVNDSRDKKDCICKKEGIISLESNKSFEFAWTAEFSE